VKTVVIAGGGTGGHLYPAIAIARAIQRLNPAIKIHFVGTEQGLEKKIIPQEGFPLHFIQGGKLNFEGGMLKKTITLLKMPLAFVQSVILLIQLRPSVVLGVGGYASGPFVFVAAILGFKCAIWEPNVYPGLANRILSKFVGFSFLVFEETKKYLSGMRSEVVGMPVRQEIESEFLKPEPKAPEETFRLLHFGGSQGSRAIGKALCAAIETEKAWTSGMKIIHQTGSVDHKYFQDKYKSYQQLVEVREFIFNMPECYRQADLVLARGGASTISELAAFGLPAIIVPLPAADSHQEHNAKTLADEGALRMILQKDLTPHRLVKEITELRRNPALLMVMRDKMREFFKPFAADAIARKIVQWSQ
jgi:UDP-N-acetylglucosamine--N-acetylmuramyl-(pentapeptide) pyrophosphoryl-undecaprenol N-acetylglucosamine transferase